MIVRRAWLCDFDGTVSADDIGASFVRDFSRGREAELEQLLVAWRGERIGSRALAEAEWALVRVAQTEARAYLERFTIDPAFKPFVHEAEARGDLVFIVSDGFDFYIDPLLQTAGMGHVPRAANTAHFDGNRIVPEFPFRGGCGACGNCKAQHVAAYRARGFETVMVGDGYSDRCAAQVADRVIARGSLADWCLTQGIPTQPFESFADVARIARTFASTNGGSVRGRVE